MTKSGYLADSFNNQSKNPHGSFEVVRRCGQEQVDIIPEHALIKIVS